MATIIRLEAENIKRLRSVEIAADGKPMVVVGGRNAQGKSSVLDSIEYALGGKPSAERPIRDGEKKARIVVETEELKVTRTFTEGGSKLVVEGKNGATFKSPQTLLDKMVGKLSFDPLAFARMDPKQQADTLKGLVGFDLAPLDAERQKAFDERTAVNRDVKAMEARVQAMPWHTGAPDAEVSVSELAGQMQRMVEDNNRIESSAQAIKDKARRCDEMAAQVADMQQRLAHAEACLRKEASELAEARVAIDGATATDLTEIRQKIQTADATNRQVRENRMRTELTREISAKTEAAQALTARIEAIDQEKESALAEANLPVKGLAFGDSGVTLNGIPFSQASSAEQLRVSVALGLSMNPQIKVLLIRDGSLLDADSLRLVSEMAEAAGGQVFVERVSDGAECAVIIEDGMVKGAPDETA